MQAVTGIYAATFTPFNDDFSIHWDVIESYAEKLIQSQVAGVFINGSTGEFASLTMEERKQIAERWKDIVGGQIKIIVHVGGTCLAESQELSRHANELGVDGISSVAPYYFKPTAMYDLMEYMKRIASAAPELPFYYYHIPSFTGVSFSMTDFMKDAGAQIPNLHGVKYSDSNLTDVHGCLSIEEKPCAVFFGVDEMLLGAMAMGVHAAVGSTYNFALPVYQRMIAEFNRGNIDKAKEYQVDITKLIRIIHQYGGLAALKPVMKLSGLDCGPYRPPISSTSQNKLDSLRNELEQIGFFEFTK